MKDLILASTSVYRRTLLARLGHSFRIVAPRVDEEAVKQRGWEPRELAEHLAIAKAESLGEFEPNATIIGSDQLVSFEEQIFGKPGTAVGAVEQLSVMAGRAHQLITAVAVWTKDQTYIHTDITTMHMRPLSLGEIERYVAAERPLDCAGSYKLEERGISLFDRVETQDYTAIMGLPLIALTGLLRSLGYPIP